MSKLFSGIACVLVRVDGVLTPRGTAFLVSSHHALTAFHVLRDAEGEVVLRFGVSGSTTDVRVRELPELRDEVHDWAVLHCDEPPPSREVPIPLSTAARPGAAWRSRGYLVGRQQDGLAVEGEVRDLDSSDGKVHAIQLYSPQLSGEIAVGFSGAPCLIRGRAVGIIRSVFARVGERTNAGTLYATSVVELSRNLLLRLQGNIDPELTELRDRLRASLPSRRALHVLRIGVACSLCLLAVILSSTRIRVELLDARSLPAERVQVELRDCLNRRTSGSSDELGRLQFIALRWCPTLQLVVKRYGGINERMFPIESSRFMASPEIECTVQDGSSIRCW